MLGGQELDDIIIIISICSLCISNGSGGDFFKQLVMYTQAMFLHTIDIILQVKKTWFYCHHPGKLEQSDCIGIMGVGKLRIVVIFHIIFCDHDTRCNLRMQTAIKLHLPYGRLGFDEREIIICIIGARFLTRAYDVSACTCGEYTCHAVPPSV